MHVFIKNIEDWTFVSYDKPLPVLALQSASLCEARGAYISLPFFRHSALVEISEEVPDLFILPFSEPPRKHFVCGGGETKKSCMWSLENAFFGMWVSLKCYKFCEGLENAFLLEMQILHFKYCRPVRLLLSVCLICIMIQMGTHRIMLLM